MSRHLLLPPDLRFHLGDFTRNEVDQILPSEHEINSLDIHQLTKQMIANAESYMTRHDLSAAAMSALKHWYYITNMGEKLYELALRIDDPWDETRKITGLISTNRDRAEVLGMYERSYPEDQLSLHHPLLARLVNITERLVQNNINFNEIYDFVTDMLDDHQFFEQHTPIILTAIIGLGAPMSTAPKLFRPVLERVLHFTTSHNLQYLDHRLRLTYANTLMAMGRGDEAIRQYELVEKYAIRHDFWFSHNAVNNKGIAYFTTGYWDKAIDLFSKILEEEPDNIMAVNNIADAYARKGEYEKAKPYALRYLREGSSGLVISYEFMQEIFHVLGMDEEMEELMELIRQISSENPNDFNTTILDLMEARYARYNLNMDLAQEKLAKAMQMAMNWNNTQMIFISQLEKVKLHIDLAEMRPTGNNRLRLFNAVDDIIKLSDDQGVPIGSITGLTLRAEVYRSYGETNKAVEDLQNAAKLAMEFNLEGLYNKLEAELQELTKRPQPPETTDGKSRFERLKQHVREIVGLSPNNNYEKKSITTHGTIVMSQHGLPIFTYYITDKLKTDSTLISGLVSAVSSLLNEATQSKGFLKTIQRDDFSLLFEPVMDFLVVSIVSEDSFDARQLLQRFTSRTREIMDKYNIEKSVSEIPPQFEAEMHSAVTSILNSQN